MERAIGMICWLQAALGISDFISSGPKAYKMSSRQRSQWPSISKTEPPAQAVYSPPVTVPVPVSAKHSTPRVTRTISSRYAFSGSLPITLQSKLPKYALSTPYSSKGRTRQLILTSISAVCLSDPSQWLFDNNLLKKKTDFIANWLPSFSCGLPENSPRYTSQLRG